ncbi:COR domain-containing protein [Leeuwenhoekiella sp. W20_SRS_FM14]|uniref:COR domain-containing protein n=1 Tax=Leeuwenhoekiella sp. W20_SRS_FM14 TaxID=3240270 RepID=UPI003F9B626C
MKKKIAKPSGILKLEKLCGIEIMKFDDFENGRGRVNLSDFYSVDDNNQVVSLSITHSVKQIEQLLPIREFEELSYLSLTYCELEDVSFLFPKPNMLQMFLGGNRLKDITFLKTSPLLQKLAIWDNPINDFKPLNSLRNLKELYIQNCGLENLDFITDMKDLTVLYARDNFIDEVEILTENQKLNNIDLSNNKIKFISKELAKKNNWLVTNQDNLTGFNIVLNPLEYPPSSVIELGDDSVKSYYKATETYGHGPLSEGRIIVVGDGSAGKSSLIERVLHDTFEQGKSQTNGIFIENWRLSHIDQRELTFHIWDFGGQEIQHAVHKFFFTEGCLYVLVLDNRKEEEPEYWLQQIESLGGKAPVLVVFNKQDDNVTEIADRKFLKEKYANIVGFYNTSCKTSFGINDFKEDLERHVIKLRTVEEQFPNNWFKIKKAIEECTSGDQHYLDYKTFSKICKKHNVKDEKTQKLLLKYFTTIGAVTWFGDTYLNFLHVLSPKWITQGVYKIITSKKTARLYGVINVNDFDELLEPSNEEDYIYESSHYGYILSMMKKFDLCYTPDDKSLLIPSAFGKVPKVEYRDFRGENVRTYILQFKDYMPLALIHRFTAKKLPYAFENNYWYSGIVIQDSKSDSLAMVHADKELKRIYVRIKGNEKLGLWEHIRRELQDIISSYAQVEYNELVSLDEKSINTVTYEDLISHIKANRTVYFHSKLRQDFNVGYLIGLFESREQTIEKFQKEKEDPFDFEDGNQTDIKSLVVNILNNNSPQVSTSINTSINVDIDINIVNNISSEIKGEAGYLLEELGDSNKDLSRALQRVIEFADDAKSARNSGGVVENGWGRKLKSVIKTLSNSGEKLKNIDDGAESLKSILTGLKDLVNQFHLDGLKDLFEIVVN